MFPLERVSFNFMKNLPFLRFLQIQTISDQLPMAPSCQIDVGFRGFPCAFLKRMKHVDSLVELGDIENSVFDSRVNPYFGYPLANTWHRFPIDRFQSLLYKTKALSRQASRIFRKRPDIIERGSGPYDGFLGHDAVYKILYLLSNMP
jgi:hypothetical protein